MNSDGQASTEHEDEALVLEGFKALVRVITRNILEVLPAEPEVVENEPSRIVRNTEKPKPTTIDNRFVSADELAKILSLPRSSIWRYAREGSIPSIRIGQQVRFDRNAVLESLRMAKTGQP